MRENKNEACLTRLFKHNMTKNIGENDIEKYNFNF